MAKIGFEELWPIVEPQVRGVCRLAFRNEADVDEVVQDIALRIYLGLHTFRGNGTLRGWVMAITRHEIADAGRRLSRRKRFEIPRDETHADPKHYPEYNLDPPKTCVASDVRASIRAAGSRGRLSSIEVSCLELRLDGRKKSWAEIGEILQITPAQCSVHFHRAKHKLYEIVMITNQEWFGGPTGLAAALDRALAEVPALLSRLEEQLFRKAVLNREPLSTRGGHKPLRSACEKVARFTQAQLFGDE